VFWSLLPVGLSLGGLVGVRLWRLMSGVQLVALMVASAWVIWQRRSVPREEQEQFLTLIIAVLAGIMVLLQLANVLGWPGQPSPAPYFFAVLVFLIMCAVYFMRLLFARLL